MLFYKSTTSGYTEQYVQNHNGVIMKRFLLLFTFLPTYNKAESYIDYGVIGKTALVTSAATLIPTLISYATIRKARYEAYKNNTNFNLNPEWKNALLTDAASIGTFVAINAALGNHYIPPYLMGGLLVGVPLLLTVSPNYILKEDVAKTNSKFTNLVINFLKIRDKLRENRAGLIGFAALGLYNLITKPKEKKQEQKKQ